MNGALLKKCFRETQLLFWATAVALFAFCWLRVWIVSLLPMERFRTIVQQFREFERFLPVPFDQLFTYSGRIALTYDELIVVMGISVWAIGRGSDVVAGELGRGTMEMLLAQPVSRWQVLTHQSLVTVAGLALLSTAVWLGVAMGIRTTTVEDSPPISPLAITLQKLDRWDRDIAAPAEPVPRVAMSSKVSPRIFVTASVNLFAFGFLLAGLSSLMSSWDRYRWRTIGIVASVYVVQLIVKIVGLAAPGWRWLLRWSFFTAYDPERFVSITVNSPQDAWSLMQCGEQGQWLRVGPLGCDLILLGLGATAYLLAGLIFSRRDLPAPL